MTVLETILKGAELGLDALRLAEPHMSPGGRLRIREVIVELGELIADEIERERFGRSSTESNVPIADPFAEFSSLEAPSPVSTKPGGRGET